MILLPATNLYIRLLHRNTGITLTYQIINFKLQISIVNLKSCAFKAHSLISLRVDLRITTSGQWTAAVATVCAGTAASHETVGLLEEDVLQQRLGVDVLLTHNL